MEHHAQRPRRLLRCDRGAAAVEFALLLPLLLGLTAAAIDFGMAFRVKIMLHGAAGNAATYASGSPCDTPGIVARARDDLPASGNFLPSAKDPVTGVPKTQITVTLTDPAICSAGAATQGVKATVRLTSSYDLLTRAVLGMFGAPESVSVDAADTVRVAGR